jgi:hypothetical protein
MRIWRSRDVVIWRKSGDLKIWRFENLGILKIWGFENLGDLKIWGFENLGI